MPWWEPECDRAHREDVGVVSQDIRTRDAASTAQGDLRSPWLMLGVATLGFALNFWAWALLSPLGPLFRDDGRLGDLSEADVSLMVAVPVIVGSLGRIVVGALTDRYGGRVMFPLVSAATVVPVLFLAFAALGTIGIVRRWWHD